MTQRVDTDSGVKQLKEKMGFESTELSGRVIRALHEDTNLMALSGKTILTAEAAARYGISAVAGYEPKSHRPAEGFEIFCASMAFDRCLIGVALHEHIGIRHFTRRIC